MSGSCSAGAEAVRLYDECFARMWQFYLASSEMAFRKQGLMNFQILLAKRQDVVPMTRSYVARNEGALAFAEQQHKPKPSALKPTKSASAWWRNRRG